MDQPLAPFIHLITDSFPNPFYTSACEFPPFIHLKQKKIHPFRAKHTRIRSTQSVTRFNRRLKQNLPQKSGDLKSQSRPPYSHYRTYASGHLDEDSFDIDGN